MKPKDIRNFFVFIQNTPFVYLHYKSLRLFWGNDPDPFDRYIVLIAIDPTDETKKARIRVKRDVFKHPLDTIVEEIVDGFKQRLNKDD